MNLHSERPQFVFGFAATSNIEHQVQALVSNLNNFAWSLLRYEDKKQNGLDKS